MTSRYDTSEASFELAHEFTAYHGEYPKDQMMKWETLSSIRKRMRAVADKYADYDKVIFVSHGMALRTLTYIEHLKPAQIVECEYQRGQADCVYWFGG